MKKSEKNDSEKKDCSQLISQAPRAAVALAQQHSAHTPPSTLA